MRMYRTMRGVWPEIMVEVMMVLLVPNDVIMMVITMILAMVNNHSDVQ